MSTHQNIDRICVGVLIAVLAITILFMNGSTLGIETIIDEDAEAVSVSGWYTRNDLDGSWDSTAATVITLNGSSAQVFGKGAYAYDGDVVITNAGAYVVSGTLTDGSIIIDAYRSSKIWLLFDGADISCSDDAAIRIEQAEKVFLTLAEGSENSLTSGETYTEEARSDGRGGTIFARDDLTINGSGSLRIEAQYKHGIDANDELVITGGEISIIAPSDGIHVNDSVRLQDMALIISVGDDGIHCDNEVIITGGEILIDSCYEGIEALTIDVRDGEVTIYPKDDGFNANGTTGSFGFSFPGFSGSTEQTSVTVEDTWLHISGGTITIVNSSARDADGLDSNGDIVISGGSIRVSLVNSGSNSALDCGSESGGQLIITGGDVVACGSYSMAEGFDNSSEQCSILYNIRNGAEAGTTIRLEDKDGNALISYEAPCSFSSVVLSSPEMQPGETYLLIIGDNEEEITLSEISASFGDVQSTMFGGNMNWGGMQDRGSFGHGGRQPRNSTGSGMGERPSPADEMPDMSGMPVPGEMPDFGGKKSDMDEIPVPGEMPDFDEEMPAFDGKTPAVDRMQAHGEIDMREWAQPSGTEGQGISLASYSADTYRMTAVCLLVLLVGISFAWKYRKNN